MTTETQWPEPAPEPDEATLDTEGMGAGDDAATEPDDANGAL
jgi:hypothetical protein